MVGLAFKASVAPFHQWTPDVYQGAPTPVTAFMAVATKAAALGVTIRLFDVALIGASDVWQPVLGFLAAVTIIVGNVGALGQTSLKRMLAYSSSRRRATCWRASSWRPSWACRRRSSTSPCTWR